MDKFLSIIIFIIFCKVVTSTEHMVYGCPHTGIIYFRWVLTLLIIIQTLLTPSKIRDFVWFWMRRRFFFNSYNVKNRGIRATLSYNMKSFLFLSASLHFIIVTFNLDSLLAGIIWLSNWTDKSVFTRAKRGNHFVACFSISKKYHQLNIQLVTSLNSSQYYDDIVQKIKDKLIFNRLRWN